MATAAPVATPTNICFLELIERGFHLRRSMDKFALNKVGRGDFSEQSKIMIKFKSEMDESQMISNRIIFLLRRNDKVQTS
jgi:hypothetical protein